MGVPVVSTAMLASRVEVCAQTNALWCDAVLKAAGAKTGFHAGYWRAEGRVLPICPNVVTLSATPGAGFEAALAELPQDAAVRDSFDCLDLGSLGFRKLVSATWLFRPALTDRKPPIRSDWKKITYADGFRKWLAGWNADEKLRSVFSLKLLETGTVTFAAIERDGALRAGAVFSAGPRVDGKETVGLGNLFCRRNWRYSALHDLLEPYAHKSVVTFETEDGVLPVYRQLGFEPCGRLAVWLKTA
jgi:hypothetical protein